MQLSDEVSQLCKERTEILGQTLAHVDEIGHSFEDMNRWLDEVERDLAGQPSVTTATPSHELAKQQQHNLELSAVIAAQTPLVERFEYNVNSLAELVGPADVQALRQIYDQIVGRYNDVKNQVKSRGEAIDSILDATEAFGDRLDVFLATLEGAAESLRQPAAVSADPGLLQNRIAENEALLDSLREKEAALDAMKERANELLARAQPGDAAASEVAAKIQALEQLWGEIGRGAEMRGAFLNDALAKAHQFWAELDDCQKAIDDLKEAQAELTAKRPEYEAVRRRGQSVCDHAPKAERRELEGRSDGLKKEWERLDKMSKERLRKAEEAVLESGAFEDAIADLEAWCDAELLDAETDLAMDGAKVHGDVETIEAAADARAEALRKAMEQAEDFDAKAHGLLAWMDGLDDRLKAAGKEPNLDKAIPAAQAVLDELKAEEARKEVVLARDEWKRVWLTIRWAQNALDEAKEMLEEMKRLEGWEWEDWKERYCDWNDHAKGRVTDLFRRIDRPATGNHAKMSPYKIERIAEGRYRFGDTQIKHSEPQFAVPGPIIKIREKTERNMPMFPGQHRPGGSAHSSNSRLRTPKSDVSLGDSHDWQRMA
ncbi:unnamed protein product, partial [Mesorhabditis spiculigera]